MFYWQIIFICLISLSVCITTIINLTFIKIKKKSDFKLFYCLLVDNINLPNNVQLMIYVIVLVNLCMFVWDYVCVRVEFYYPLRNIKFIFICRPFF